jgi:hypothetical protein
MTVRLSPTTAKRGQRVELQLDPPAQNVMVYLNGRKVPKRVQGNTLTVVVPGWARSGHFEVEWEGRRYRSPMLHVE